MELLILLGLIGSLSMVGVFSGGDDADAPTPEAPVEEPTDGLSPTPPDENSGGDTVVGNDQAEVVRGGAGIDSLEGFGGSDTLFGEAGNDTLVGGRGGDLFYGGDGDDIIVEDRYLISNPSELDDGNDTAYGGAGNDYIRTLVGDDLIYGGTGDDSIWADAGDDVVFGGDGADTVLGFTGDDSLDGGAGDDALHGEEGMNTLVGGAGNDTLDGIGIFPSADDPVNTSLLFGGDGDDVLSFQDGSTVSGGAGADTFVMTDTLSDTLVSRIEDFDPAEDQLLIRLAVGDGDGGGLNLVPRADGLGTDLYLGDDLVAEVMGSATITLADISVQVGLEATPGGVTTFTIGDEDPTYNPLVNGSRGDDHIIGGTGDDVIVGNGGSDLLEGGAGNDTLTGDGGSARVLYDGPGLPGTLFVDIQTDTIVGGAGDDDIWSINGNVMTGGDGSDVFVVQGIAGTPELQALLPISVITDFDPGEDVLVLGSGAAPGNISINVLPDGTGSEVLMNGAVVVRVIGGQTLTLGDIRFQTIDEVDDYRA